jgi:hypothetical protein
MARTAIQVDDRRRLGDIAWFIMGKKSAEQMCTNYGGNKEIAGIVGFSLDDEPETVPN